MTPALIASVEAELIPAPASVQLAEALAFSERFGRDLDAFADDLREFKARIDAAIARGVGA